MWGETHVEGDRVPAGAGSATPEVEGRTAFLPFVLEEAGIASTASKRDAKATEAEEGVTGEKEEEATVDGGLRGKRGGTGVWISMGRPVDPGRVSLVVREKVLTVKFGGFGGNVSLDVDEYLVIRYLEAIPGRARRDFDQDHLAHGFLGFD